MNEQTNKERNGETKERFSGQKIARNEWTDKRKKKENFKPTLIFWKVLESVIWFSYFYGNSIFYFSVFFF